jgi:hypothetical protein
MKTSRRGLFGWLFGGVAAVAMPKMIAEPVVRSISIISPGTGYTSVPAVYGKLNDITRKAFMPAIRAEIYNRHPFLSRKFYGDDLNAEPPLP